MRRRINRLELPLSSQIAKDDARPGVNNGCPASVAACRLHWVRPEIDDYIRNTEQASASSTERVNSDRIHRTGLAEKTLEDHERVARRPGTQLMRIGKCRETTTAVLADHEQLNGDAGVQR